MRRIHEVARFTGHPRAVAEFYALVLDRPVPELVGEAFNFDVEGVNLFVHPLDAEPVQAGWPDGVDHIAFEVDDLDSDCQRLAEAGMDVLGPSDFPWGRCAYVRDPDGRLVELHGPGISYE